MLRILIADDSAVTREFLLHLLEGDPEIRVVAAVRNGREAVEQVERLRPDVVLMDVFMPLMDGYEATRHIMQHVPTPIVVISSGLDGDGAASSFDALAAGAVAVLEKPRGGDRAAPDKAAELIQTVKMVAGVKVVRRWPKRPRGIHAGEVSRRVLDGPVDRGSRTEPGGFKELGSSRPGARVVAIGASTGGPAALVEILENLPPDFPVPMLIVQHIAAGFVQGLADWLDSRVPIRVRVAESGEPARAGSAYIAPDGTHLGITVTGRINLSSGLAVDGHRPSISALFAAVAESYGPAGLGILLTGMGQDGAAGMLRLRVAGGLTVVQSEESCVVFGMPRKAIESGAAQYVLAPREIAEALRMLSRSEPNGKARGGTEP